MGRGNKGADLPRTGVLLCCLPVSDAVHLNQFFCFFLGQHFHHCQASALSCHNMSKWQSGQPAVIEMGEVFSPAGWSLLVLLVSPTAAAAAAKEAATRLLPGVVVCLLLLLLLLQVVASAPVAAWAAARCVLL